MSSPYQTPEFRRRIHIVEVEFDGDDGLGAMRGIFNACAFVSACAIIGFVAAVTLRCWQ